MVWWKGVSIFTPCRYRMSWPTNCWTVHSGWRHMSELYQTLSEVHGREGQPIYWAFTLPSGSPSCASQTLQEGFISTTNHKRKPLGGHEDTVHVRHWHLGSCLVVDSGLCAWEADRNIPSYVFVFNNTGFIVLMFIYQALAPEFILKQNIIITSVWCWV